MEAVKEGSETLNTIVPIMAIFIFGGIIGFLELLVSHLSSHCPDYKLITSLFSCAIGYAVYIAYENYVVNSDNGLIVVNT